MRSKIKFKCPRCGNSIETYVDIKDFDEAVELTPPCKCGFSQVVLSALSSGIESIVNEENEPKKE